MPVIPTDFNPGRTPFAAGELRAEASPAYFGIAGAATAAGGEQISAEARQFATQYADAIRQKTASNLAFTAMSQISQAQEKWSRIPDSRQAIAGFDAETRQIRDQIAGQTEDPEVQALVLRQLNSHVIWSQLGVQNRSFALEASAHRAQLDEQLFGPTGYAAMAMQAPNAPARASIIDSAAAAIKGAVAAGWMYGEHGEERLERFRDQVNASVLRRDLRENPQRALAELDSGQYDGQISPAQRAALQPEIDRARGVKALSEVLSSGIGLPAQLPSDPNAAAELIKTRESGGSYTTGYGGVDLSNAPHDDTGFPQWAGAPGPAGITHAAGAYQFEPGTWRKYAVPLGIHDFSPASQDRVFRAAFGAEGYAPWRETFAQRSLTAAYDRIDQMGLDPETALRVKEEARANYAALEADQLRQERIQAQQQKAAREARENEIIEDAYSGHPKIAAQDVANDPAFASDPEARLRMIAVVRSGGQAGPPPGPSHAEAMQLIQRIRLPADDPNRIASLDPIYDALIAGRLTKSDFDFVRNEFINIRSPAGEIFAKRKAEFIKAIEPQIDRSILSGIPDLTGKERLYEYEYALDRKIDEYRKAGKDPNDLLDPSKPDYYGKPEVLKPYQRTLQQLLSDLPGAGEPPQWAIDRLREHPEWRAAFDQKFGPGAAAKVLGPAAGVAAPMGR